MPGKEGPGTSVEFKSEFPAIKNFVMSGRGKNSAERYLRMANGLCADSVFVKPFNREDILSAAAKC